MIESKLTFFDKQVEVLFWDSVILSQHTFCLIPEILNSVDVVDFLLGKMGAVIDAMMVKF